MNVNQFRTHDTFPSEWADQLASNHILQIVMNVMEESHPARFAIVGDNNEDVSPTRAAIELGMTRGYSKALDTLKLLAVRKPKAVDLGEPTYAKDETVEAK